VKQGMNENGKEQGLTDKDVARSSRKSRPGLERRRDSTTERCCDLDRVRAGERR